MKRPSIFFSRVLTQPHSTTAIMQIILPLQIAVSIPGFESWRILLTPDLYHFSEKKICAWWSKQKTFCFGKNWLIKSQSCRDYFKWLLIWKKSSQRAIIKIIKNLSAELWCQIDGFILIINWPNYYEASILHFDLCFFEKLQKSATIF